MRQGTPHQGLASLTAPLVPRNRNKTSPFVPSALPRRRPFARCAAEGVVMIVMAVAPGCSELDPAVEARTSTSPALAATPAPIAEKDAIRPFRVCVSEGDLADLRRRLAATRWPDKETVADQSQ